MTVLNRTTCLAAALAFVMIIFILPCYAGRFPVMRVVDGDTIIINYYGKKEKIRMLNVDTPESVHPDPRRNTLLGKKASNYTRKRLSGKQVDLAFESQKRGRYGRLLAYVILDGENFNLELVRNGWSNYYTKYGKSPSFHGAFLSAQNQAKKSGLGIWNETALTISTPAIDRSEKKPSASQPRLTAGHAAYSGNIKSMKFHHPGCRHYDCKNCIRSFSDRKAAIDAGYKPCGQCQP